MPTLTNFLRLLLTFAKFWQFLSTSINLSHVWQFLSTFGNFPNICQFLADFENLPTFGSFCQLLTCHLAILSSYRVILPSSICQFVNLLASQLVSFTACASWSSRACHNVECDNVTDSVSRSVTQSLNHCLSAIVEKY